MNHFVTIYTDPIFDFEGVTHTFISLTHKSPDKLELENEKWYEKKYSSITIDGNDEGFFGFGGVEFNKKMILSYIGGKVFENNHYIMEYDYENDIYRIQQIRSKETFQLRCILEVSKEQYNIILAKIRNELITTKNITPISSLNKNKELSYSLLLQNCVHWVQKHLEYIGVELLVQQRIPSFFSNNFEHITTINKVFLQFQNVDKSLETIIGAKAFKNWIRMISKNIYKQEYNLWRPINIIVKCYKDAETLLNKLLKNNQNIKGTFHFIYVDNGQLKIMKPENDYVPETLQELDASKPYNNYTLGKYLYFIFIPDEEYEYIYHKYNYGQVDKEYNQSINECYKQVLLGNTDNIKYYSQSLNKLLDKQKSNIFHQV